MLLLVLFLPAVAGYNVLMYSIKFGYSHMNYIGSIADTLQEAGYNVVSFEISFYFQVYVQTVIMPQVDETITNTGVYLARLIEVPVDEGTKEALRARKAFEKGENAWTTDTSDPRVAATVSFGSPACHSLGLLSVVCSATVFSCFIVSVCSQLTRISVW